MRGRSAEASIAVPSRPAKMLPGEEGVWILVLGDMMVFGLFFVTYLYYRAREAAVFDRSQDLLNLHFGATNTLLLLTSSWFVVMGVEAVRDGGSPRAKTLLRLAFLCGVGFCAIKAIEYTEIFHEGLTLVTNDFFMFYFMYTGIHLLHVAIGLGVLLFLIHKADAATPQEARLFESGATFWHMVDLLWIMLFPLLYLVRQTVGWLFKGAATLVWALLFSATCVSWALGSHHLSRSGVSPGLASVSVMLIAMVKIRLVLIYFMELKRAPWIWRAVFETWVALVSIAIITTYLTL